MQLGVKQYMLVVVTLPNNLKSLTFGERFNESLKKSLYKHDLTTGFENGIRILHFNSHHKYQLQALHEQLHELPFRSRLDMKKF